MKKFKQMNLISLVTEGKKKKRIAKTKGTSNKR